MSFLCHVLLMNLKDYRFQEGLRTEYLAFGYLTAALRARGHKVTWLDENTDGPYTPEAFDFRSHLPVHIVGMSPSYTTYRRALLWLARWKRECADIVTILGGQHVMMAPDEVLLDSSAIDFVCLGEGEEPISLLADAVSRGSACGSIPGCASRRAGRIEWGERLNPPPPLDDLPWPARDSLEKWIRQKRVSQVSVQNSRGCRYGCVFCHFPRIRNRGYGYDGRFRSPGSVAKELVHLQETYGVREFFFNSPQFGGRYSEGRRWMTDFADLMISLNRDIRFEIECRSDTLDDQLLITKLSKAGLIRVFLGLEAGNTEMLRSYGKAVSIDTHIRVISYLSSRGISISGSGFIMFHPLATLEDLRENAEFLKDVGDTHIHTLWSRFRLFPGIAQAKVLAKLGLVDQGRRHDEALAYRFIDTRTERIAHNRLRALDSVLLAKSSRFVRLIDIEIGLEEANLPAIVGGSQERHLKDLLSIRESSCGVRDAVLTAFFDHFLYCLRLVEADCSSDGWDRAANRLHGNLQALDHKISAVLKRHDSVVCGLLRGSTLPCKNVMRGVS